MTSTSGAAATVEHGVAARPLTGSGGIRPVPATALAVAACVEVLVGAVLAAVNGRDIGLMIGGRGGLDRRG